MRKKTKRQKGIERRKRNKNDDRDVIMKIKNNEDEIEEKCREYKHGDDENANKYKQ